jgi:hypothetical protein
MASCACFISWVFILVLVAYCGTLGILSANRALILTHFLGASCLYHLRYLVNAHSVLEYAKLLENETTVREKPHCVGSGNSKVGIAVGTVSHRS